MRKAERLWTGVQETFIMVVFTTWRSRALFLCCSVKKWKRDVTLYFGRLRPIKGVMMNKELSTNTKHVKAKIFCFLLWYIPFFISATGDKYFDLPSCMLINSIRMSHPNVTVFLLVLIPVIYIGSFTFRYVLINLRNHGIKLQVHLSRI